MAHSLVILLNSASSKGCVIWPYNCISD